MTTATNPRTKKATPNVERRAYSLDEWRAMYGLGKNSTYNLIAEGTLPTVKVGRRRLVTVEGDEQFRKNIGA
jgi:hypothetical protein